MDSFDVLTSNITQQIEGWVYLKISFTNYKEEFVQLSEDMSIKPPFCNWKNLSKDLYDELTGMIVGNDFDEIYGDVTEVESNMTYDDFFDRFYNNVDPISKELS